MEIIQVFILLTLIQQILLFVLKRKPNILCCGLFCYVGETSPDPLKLKILAIYNQVRGDQATGMTVDDEVVKELIPAKEFIAKESDTFNLLSYDLDNKVVLGHCRQATHNYDRNNLNFAHPHQTKIDNKDCLRLVHNGTVRNCYDLAKKYDTTMTEKSDSILIAELISKGWKDNNLSILKEYEGAATVVFYHVGKKNTLYVHRDKDRELFYWNETPTSCYISSVRDSLVAIGANYMDVKEFEPGILVKFLNGAIVKTWDMTDKKPYSAPVKTHVSHSYTPTKYNKSQPNISVRNGFYWQDHEIRHNGHLFTGQLYINKKNGKSEKFVKDPENYDMYYVIMGLIMKDKESSDKLASKCSNGNAFDPEKFKKLLPSNKQIYTLYPVLGKTFKSDNYIFFWSDEQEKLQTLDEVYSWSPLLSGKTFSVDRTGFLTKTEDIKKSLNKKEVLSELFATATKKYSTIYEVLSSFRITSGETIYPYGNFLDLYLELISESGLIDPNDISTMLTLKDSGEYMGDAGNLDTLLLSSLKNYQMALIWSKSSEDGTIEHYEEIQSPNSAYYQTAEFLNEILFGDYPSIADLALNYIQTDDESELKPLYEAVIDFFKDLNLITLTEAVELSSKAVKDSSRTLERTYDDLKKEKSLKEIMEILKNQNTTDRFAALYDKKTSLDQKMHKNHKEKVEYSLISLSLAYVAGRKNFLDFKKLEDEFGIKQKDVEECMLKTTKVS